METPAATLSMPRVCRLVPAADAWLIRPLAAWRRSGTTRAIMPGPSCPGLSFASARRDGLSFGLALPAPFFHPREQSWHEP